MIKVYYPVLVDFQGEDIDMNIEYSANNRKAGYLGSVLFKKFGQFAKTYSVRMKLIALAEITEWQNKMEERELS